MEETQKIQRVGDSDYVFDLHVIIGVGGFGKVFRGKHSKNKMPVAVKKVSKSQFKKKYAENEWPKFVDKYLKKELEIHRKLDDEHLVRLFYDFHPNNDEYYLVLELCEGDALSLSENLPKITTEVVLDLLLDVLRGLQVLAQESIVHRDLSVRNILYVKRHGPSLGPPQHALGGEDGFSPYRFKISDFGLSRRYDQEVEKDFSQVGALYIRPPGKKSTVIVDIFSLCCSVVHFLTRNTNYLVPFKEVGQDGQEMYGEENLKKKLDALFLAPKLQIDDFFQGKLYDYLFGVLLTPSKEDFTVESKTKEFYGIASQATSVYVYSYTSHEALTRHVVFVADPTIKFKRPTFLEILLHANIVKQGDLVLPFKDEYKLSDFSQPNSPIFTLSAQYLSSPSSPSTPSLHEPFEIVPGDASFESGQKLLYCTTLWSQYTNYMKEGCPPEAVDESRLSAAKKQLHDMDLFVKMMIDHLQHYFYSTLCNDDRKLDKLSELLTAELKEMNAKLSKSLLVVNTAILDLASLRKKPVSPATHARAVGCGMKALNDALQLCAHIRTHVLELPAALHTALVSADSIISLPTESDISRDEVEKYIDEISSLKARLSEISASQGVYIVELNEKRSLLAATKRERDQKVKENSVLLERIELLLKNDKEAEENIALLRKKLEEAEQVKLSLISSFEKEKKEFEAQIEELSTKPAEFDVLCDEKESSYVNTIEQLQAELDEKIEEKKKLQLDLDERQKTFSEKEKVFLADIESHKTTVETLQAYVETLQPLADETQSLRKLARAANEQAIAYELDASRAKEEVIRYVSLVNKIADPLHRSIVVFREATDTSTPHVVVLNEENPSLDAIMAALLQSIKPMAKRISFATESVPAGQSFEDARRTHHFPTSNVLHLTGYFTS